MHPPNSNNATQYFLGVAGEQIGPLTEAEVLQRIKSGDANHESLIWHEGMEAWSPITSLPIFDAAIKFREQSLAQTPRPKEKTEPKKVSENVLSASFSEDTNAFIGDEKSVSIIFDETQSRLGDKSFANDRMLKVVGGLIGLIILVSGYFYISAYLANSKAEAMKAKAAGNHSDTRQVQLGKATSELMLDQKNSEQTLLALIKSNSIDAVAQEATRTLLDHYTRSKRYVDAGKLMMLVKRPGEAAKYFSQDPAAKAESENALFAAYQGAKDPAQRKGFLIDNIKVLLVSNGQMPKAIERIHQLEKEFPGEPHPYTYYLKNIDERINDIFSRISFHFVQNLMGYVEMELPQLTLMDRPLVEVKKDKSNLYKIVGTYKGEILLNKDRLNKVQFLFWLNGDRWTLVDTNLTRERKKWAEQERAKLKNVGISADQMIRNLEDAFRVKFPNAALHEKDLLRVPASSPKPSDF